MSQYFSRLAARSGVVEAAPSRLSRSSVPNETISWSEQSAEVVAASTASTESTNATSTRAESNIDTDVASASQRDTATKSLVFENRKNAVTDIENGGVASPFNMPITANANTNAIEISSTSTVPEKQHVSASPFPTASLISNKAISEKTSSNVLEDHAYTNSSLISSSTASASPLSESLLTSKHSNLSPPVELQPAQKQNALSRAQKNVTVDKSISAMPYSDNTATTESYKATSRSIDVPGNSGTERTSSRPADNSDVSERVALSVSRQPTQIHIGKIELEIHAAAPKAIPPVPMQIGHAPAPAAATKRSTGFSASRHYLRSR